jgi:hypothetical protein
MPTAAPPSRIATLLALLVGLAVLNPLRGADKPAPGIGDSAAARTATAKHGKDSKAAQQEFERKLRTLRQEYEAKVKASRKAYVAALRAALAEETKKGRLEVAVAIKEAIAKLESQPAPVWPADSLPVAASNGDEQGGGAAGEAAEVEAGAAADPAVAKLMTPALLKRKFAAEAAFDPKRNELTLKYDFSTKDQLKDFDLGDSKPSLTKRVLTLQPGESIRHVVRFRTLSMTGQIQIGNMSGRHFKTSENIWMGGVGDGDVYILNENGQNQTEQYVTVPVAAAAKVREFELNVTPTRLALRMGDARTGLATKTPLAGHVELLGGPGGNSYAKLVLRGQVDPEWAEEFFEN